MNYSKANQAKACFDDVYCSPTPHAYIAMMARNGYEIGEQARPYCTAAARLLRKINENAWPVQMLDLGCSYGIGSAFVKYCCSFDEMVAFFSSRVPRDQVAASQTVRAWLNVTPEPLDVRCVGIDSSEPAIEFALKAGMLDGGIARNFEDPEIVPTDEEIAWLRSCNLMISTGAIGYVTDCTLDKIIPHLGQEHPGSLGPFAVMTILRMFESRPVREVFEKHGFKFEKVPGVMLAQRKFTNRKEREKVLEVLRQRGLDTSEWEDKGKHYAELFLAARPEHFPELMLEMTDTHAEFQDKKQKIVGYIRR